MRVCTATPSVFGAFEGRQNEYCQMKKIALLFFALLPMAPLAALRASADVGLPHVDWDASTERLLQPDATYGRMRRIADGTILCCFQMASKSWVMRSKDEARTWESPVEAGSGKAVVAANPELCALRNGSVLLFFNERPYDEGRTTHFTIRMSTSRDGGRTWQARPEPVFIAGTQSREGCWEPAAAQMPDSTLHVFFAHELPGQQEIATMTSHDEGVIWSEPSQASLRAKHRDGMPVPLILQDGRAVFSIEDNGVAPRAGEHPVFRPTIIEFDSAGSVGADSPRRWMALRDQLPGKCNVAAPYLARLKSGETLLSVQSNEDDPRWRRMAVYVGDASAKNFSHRSLPFGLPPETNSEWNSLFVKNADTVIALTHATIKGQCGL